MQPCDWLVVQRLLKQSTVGPPGRPTTLTDENDGGHDGPSCPPSCLGWPSVTAVNVGSCVSAIMGKRKVVKFNLAEILG